MQRCVLAAFSPFTCGREHDREFILVVDDLPTVLKVIEVSLQREGYEVVSVSSGGLALHWLASREGRVPNLILSTLSGCVE